MKLLPVVNQFFGETVTVSGLLTGQDVVPALRDSGCSYALLPRVMFDHQGMQTLDAYTPRRIAEETCTSVYIADDIAELVRYIGSIGQCDAVSRAIAAA
jgi:hypothetical protein